MGQGLIKQAAGNDKYLRGVPKEYKHQAEVFIQFLKDKDYGIGDIEGWRSFQKSLVGIVKEGHPAYSKRMEGKHLSASIQQKYIQAMVDRVRYAIDHTRMDSQMQYALTKSLEKIKRPKRPKPQPKFLTPDQVWKLINSLTADKGEYARLFSELSLMIEFLFTTGLRISQMLSLTVKDFKPDNGHYVCNSLGKGGASHSIEVKKELFNRVLKAFPADRRVYLFSQGGGKPFRREPITMRIKRASKRILGVDIGAHGMRHSLATHAYNVTHDIMKVQELLGHANASTTSKMYIHTTLSREEKDSIIEKSRDPGIQVPPCP